jgi:hypothetical protein
MLNSYSFVIEVVRIREYALHPCIKVELKMITQSELKTLIKYEPSTGIFTWIIPTSLRVNKGDEVGYRQSNQCGNIYLQTSIHKIKYYLHRLAWLYMTGELPTKQIDHINGKGTDNCWSNLREVSHHVNSKNQRLRSTNTSGVTGVCWSESRKKWCASITVKGKTIPLGRHEEKDKAIKVRKNAERDFNFHPNHGQVKPL